ALLRDVKADAQIDRAYERENLADIRAETLRRLADDISSVLPPLLLAVLRVDHEDPHRGHVIERERVDPSSGEDRHLSDKGCLARPLSAREDDPLLPFEDAGNDPVL